MYSRESACVLARVCAVKTENGFASKFDVCLNASHLRQFWVELLAALMRPSTAQKADKHLS